MGCSGCFSSWLRCTRTMCPDVTYILAVQTQAMFQFLGDMWICLKQLCPWDDVGFSCPWPWDLRDPGGVVQWWSEVIVRCVVISAGLFPIGFADFQLEGIVMCWNLFRNSSCTVIVFLISSVLCVSLRRSLVVLQESRFLLFGGGHRWSLSLSFDCGIGQVHNRQGHFCLSCKCPLTRLRWDACVVRDFVFILCSIPNITVMHHSKRHSNGFRVTANVMEGQRTEGSLWNKSRLSQSIPTRPFCTVCHDVYGYKFSYHGSGGLLQGMEMEHPRDTHCKYMMPLKRLLRRNAEDDFRNVFCTCKMLVWWWQVLTIEDSLELACGWT